MIIPKKLKRGNLIAIVSPAGKVNTELIIQASNSLQKRGYRVKVYPNAMGSYYQFSADDNKRLADLQNAMDNPEVACILCARGGYGMARIIDKLDFTELLKKPKWLVGFSDITVLHCALQNVGIASIHGPMAKTFSNATEESVQSFFNALENDKLNYSIDTNILNLKGNANGSLVGGNLSIFSSLLGTPFMPDTKGKILFVEDLNEYLYRLDRMMISIKLAGVFNNIAGLVVGGFTDMLDNDSPFGKTAYEIISEHVSSFGFPIAYDFPAGHISDNRALMLGAETMLEVKNDSVELTQNLLDN